MASTNSIIQYPYDVFVSFRGTDTRSNIIDHLFAALERKGIVSFKDDKNIRKGESIAPELRRAIEGSQIFIVVFSKNYAFSTWCLRELDHILYCALISGRYVLPIFYDVDPSDVRHQKGTYAEAFEKHEEMLKHDLEMVTRWRKVLTQVADTTGWDLRHKPQYAEIEKIAKLIMDSLGSPIGKSTLALSTAIIIGPQYCAPHPFDLTIVKKVMSVSNGNFVVTDVNRNIIFKVKGSLLTLRDRRVLVDAVGNPITTLRRKIVTLHDRWEAFRGESTDSKDLIFTLKRTSLMQLKTKLDVFLAGNKKEDVCDFKVRGSWLERSCIVYAGESKNIVAKMHKKHTIKSLLIGKDHFTVTVSPNVDYAFIVSLIVILDEINDS